MQIPFVDLRAQHDELRDELEGAFRATLDESAFIGGPAVAAFERHFAEFCGARHALAVSTGTDAIELALRSHGVGAGDIVVTAPHTFIGTVEGAVQLGAVPRFVDIDLTTYNLDPDRLQAYLTGACGRDAGGTLRERDSGLRVAAILPVHLYGLPADMARILALGQDFGVTVIEDACQAHGARYRLPDGRWATAGTMAGIGCFSFYPGKNLGGVGEGGAIVLDDDALVAQIAMLRDHGQSERYVHATALGVNARLDGFKAAVLDIKLRRLADWNRRRQQVAGWYTEQLADTGLPLPVEPEGSEHVYHLYVVRVPGDLRDRIRERLADRGISTGLHYPIPLHLQPAFSDLGADPGSFPNAERAAREVLSLPIYPHMTHEQVAYVGQALREAIA
jgi:dTDP-4-amino-4,6-dideoxygalactose transaminase